MNPIFQSILEALLTALGTALTGLILYYTPRVVAAIEAKLHIQLTDQQVAALSAAAQTGANALTAKIRTGLLTPAHIDPTNPVVVEQATAALARVPDAAKGQQMTVPAMAAVIASRVDVVPPQTVVVVPTRAVPTTPPLGPHT
jgi:hypothetical protein